MKNLYFYKGYIAPNENYNCYIFKHTNKAYLLVAEYRDKQYKLTDVKAMDEMYIDSWLGHITANEHPNLVEIKRIDFYAFNSIFSNVKFMIEIIETSDKTYFLQMYSKQFCEKYKKINKEKVYKLRKIFYHLFSIFGKTKYILDDLKDLFNFKSEK